MPAPLDLRRVARLAAAFVTAAAVAAACGDSSPLVPDQDGGAVDEAGVDPAMCPEVAPVEGARCLLPEGTTCAFGACGVGIARCTRGVWRYGDNQLPRPECPATPPERDTACPACWPPETTCRYGSEDCTAPDASLNTAVAGCLDGGWTVEIRPCRDGGGPDVQGDGGLDAD